MTPAMQAEIRILPGNDRCVDCGGNHPQWASVTFGALMCLECSGAHRGMGVHISFVRSVTMDSWNEKQLKLMSNGGNGDLIAFWKKHGVDPRMPHNAKYHEPASELYRERLKARVEGRPLPTEMPARKAAPTSAYDAPGGGSMSAGGFGGGDKKGSEALSGESEDAYVARQRRLQAEARARMATKFGGGGMGGVGSNSDYNPATGGYGDEPKFSLAGVGAFLGKAGAGIKDAAAAVNDDDRAAELKARAGSAWGGLKSWGSGLADKVKDLRVDNDGGDLGNFLASNRSSLGSGKQMAGRRARAARLVQLRVRRLHDRRRRRVLRPVLLPELIFQRVANVLGQRARRPAVAAAPGAAVAFRVHALARTGTAAAAARGPRHLRGAPPRQHAGQGQETRRRRGRRFFRQLWRLTAASTDHHSPPLR